MKIYNRATEKKTERDKKIKKKEEGKMQEKKISNLKMCNKKER